LTDKTNSVSLVVTKSVNTTQVVTRFRSDCLNAERRSNIALSDSVQNERLPCIYQGLNDFGCLNEGKPGRFGRALNGRTTEGTLGRCSSTVANYARRSDGGGVL